MIGAIKALRVIERELYRRKGSAASGNWGHTSFQRMDVGRGGSDPSGTGGGLAALGLDKTSTPEERHEAAARLREQRENIPYRAGRAGEDAGAEKYERWWDLVRDGRMDAILSEGLKKRTWEKPVWPERETIKDEIVTTLAEQTGLSYEDVNNSIGEWAKTSADHRMAALEMQESAERVFGLPQSEYIHNRLGEMYKERAEMGLDVNLGDGKFFSYLDDAGRETFLRTMYEHTQAELVKAGYKPGDTVRLYRGVSLPQDMLPKGVKVSDVVPVQGNALSSWSVGSGATDRFAYPGWDTQNIGLILQMDVPIESIVSTARTGYGCLKEGEVVIMGNIPGSTARVATVRYPSEGKSYDIVHTADKKGLIDKSSVTTEQE